ncbi:MAG: hypothetical protein C0615_03885 [Desulfuromonas sp.]|nr:MAG: hypothetical protein C0615_03885 [Desulfuromonas sp.]
MQLRASESITVGDLVCLATGLDGHQILQRWRFGCEAVGIAVRSIAEDEVVEYQPKTSTGDIMVKGGPLSSPNEVVSLKVACDLKTDDLICLRHQQNGEVLVDKWHYGDEAVGITAREIAIHEAIDFCRGKSTADIYVKPLPES